MPNPPPPITVTPTKRNGDDLSLSLSSPRSHKKKKKLISDVIQHNFARVKLEKTLETPPPISSKSTNIKIKREPIDCITDSKSNDTDPYDSINSKPESSIPTCSPCNSNIVQKQSNTNTSSFYDSLLADSSDDDEEYKCNRTNEVVINKIDQSNIKNGTNIAIDSNISDDVISDLPRINLNNLTKAEEPISDIKSKSNQKRDNKQSPVDNKSKYNSNSYLNIICKPPPFCKIGHDMIINDIRKYKTNVKECCPHYWKMLYNSFDVIYHSKSNENKPNNDKAATRSFCSKAIQLQYISQQKGTHSCDFDSQNYRRCLLEDFMLIEKNVHVKVLVPSDNKYMNMSNWEYLIRSKASSYVGNIYFQKNEYYVFNGIIETSPQSSHAKDGTISGTDLTWAFGIGNSGSNIAFEVNSETDPKAILVTWTHVLTGKMDGIQVWSKRNSIRNLSQNFNNLVNAKNAEASLLSLLNNIYPEIYGDSVQLGLLLAFYYKGLAQVRKKEKNKSNLINLDHIEMNDNAVKELIEEIDNTYKEAIEECFNNFTPIGKPLLPKDAVNHHIARYKELLPHHYKIMRRLLQIEKKSKLIRNIHLQEYYDRQCFYQFLAQVRVMNNHNLVHWGQVCAASSYSHGQGNFVHPRGTFFGIQSNYDSFLNHCKRLSRDMKGNIQELMKHHKYIVAGLDNNQKGYPLQHQRGGEHCKFQKVTCMLLMKLNPICEDCPSPIDHVKITYTNQKIPSPYNMHEYETIRNIPSAIAKVITKASTTPASTIDFSGSRVDAYIDILMICDDITNGVFKYLTGWSFSSNSLKCWDYQPNRFVTYQRSSLIKMFSQEKRGFINLCRRFQNENVLRWNKNANMASEIIVPPVSLRDEIKTEGYGVAVIELLILVGILIETTINDEYKRWDLCRDYKERCLILAVDGLSMDRHLGFQRKLKSVKTSFTQNYEQAKVFEKAFERIIEVNGQLHMAFHMLQSIFIVFSTLIKWFVKIVKWKRINIGKVSHNFRLCRRLAFLVQEEIERYVWDLFLSENSNTIQAILNNTDDVPTIMVNTTKHFIEWVQKEAGNTNDDRRKYLLNYIIIMRIFSKYWQSIRCGDRVTQEYCVLKWLPVFYLLKKRNYVEMVLCAIEKEYGEISFQDLETVRVNCSFKLKEDKDSEGTAYQHIAVDKVVENCNKWTKALPVKSDALSWIIHSPNVTCARRCSLNENNEFMDNAKDLSDSENITRKDYKKGIMLSHHSLTLKGVAFTNSL